MDRYYARAYLGIYMVYDRKERTWVTAGSYKTKEGARIVAETLNKSEAKAAMQYTHCCTT